MRRITYIVRRQFIANKHSPPAIHTTSLLGFFGFDVEFVFKILVVF